MWDQVGSCMPITGMSPAKVRLLKLTEEVGEVAEAFIGMHGLNSRKGVCRTRDDLLAELADVIITAAVAMSGITGSATSSTNIATKNEMARRAINDRWLSRNPSEKINALG